MSKSQNKTSNRPALVPILMALAALIVVTIFVLSAVLLLPQEDTPTFRLTDQNGDWDAQAQGKIAVFDSTIAPGSEGEYEFVITNDCGTELEYAFKLTEYLKLNAVEGHGFMWYRLKRDGSYINGGDEWKQMGVDYAGFTIMPGSQHKFTLEWKWIFEVDDEENANDTLIGVTGGELDVRIFIWAEINQ